jgi:hypothetical protein
MNDESQFVFIVRCFNVINLMDFVTFVLRFVLSSLKNFRFTTIFRANHWLKIVLKGKINRNRSKNKIKSGTNLWSMKSNLQMGSKFKKNMNVNLYHHESFLIYFIYFTSCLRSCEIKLQIDDIANISTSWIVMYYI